MNWTEIKYNKRKNQNHWFKHNARNINENSKSRIWWKKKKFLFHFLINNILVLFVKKFRLLMNEKHLFTYLFVVKNYNFFPCFSKIVNDFDSPYFFLLASSSSSYTETTYWMYLQNFLLFTFSVRITES